MSKKPLVHLKKIASNLALTNREQKLLWRRAIDNEHLFENIDITEDVIKEMCQQYWHPSQLLPSKSIKEIIDDYITRFPQLEETTLVFQKNHETLAKMPFATAVFEAKLELSVICDKFFPKIRELFKSRPDLFDPTTDYNIHKIVVEYFPTHVNPPENEIQPRKTAQQFFLQEMWEKEPESFRKTIYGTLYYWKVCQDDLWNSLPQAKKEKYYMLEKNDKMRRRLQLFKYLKESKTY